MQFHRLNDASSSRCLAAWPRGPSRRARSRRYGASASSCPQPQTMRNFKPAFGHFWRAQQSGWTVGQNVRIDSRWATSNAVEIRRQAAELAASLGCGFARCAQSASREGAAKSYGGACSRSRWRTSHSRHCREPGGSRLNQRNSPMQSKLPMHLSRRCGARTRSGTPCRSPAMLNGRCRMHGGTSLGAPRGNENAFKHGRYAAEAIRRRQETSALIRAMKTLARTSL
jgi:hypothetical protein